MKAWLRTAPVLALVACSLGTAPEPPEGALKVLFIGNSLTYENDLPRTVANLALSAGLTQCYCYQIAYPNFALEDHWDNREAVNALREESWDFVVMQQGPSALPESRAYLITWTQVFGNLIDENGAQPVMFGVWPALEREFDFPNVAASYREAADAIGALLAPAGEAWQTAWAQDSTLPLYSADNFHPSAMGTYLAALTLFERLYGRSPVGIQQTAFVDGRSQPWTPGVVLMLQEAAATANAAEDARIHVSAARRRR